MAINEAYSFKDFTGQDLSSVSKDELNGIIKGACFAQLSPNTVIFPSDMVATFQRCNLDNVTIPDGCTVEGADGIVSTQKKIKMQNDLEDWIVDGDNKPIEPLDKAKFIELNLSYDPKDIPIEKRSGDESLIDETERLAREAE
jgi:hypothetical protein